MLFLSPKPYTTGSKTKTCLDYSGRKKLPKLSRDKEIDFLKICKISWKYVLKKSSKALMIAATSWIFLFFCIYTGFLPNQHYNLYLSAAGTTVSSGLYALYWYIYRDSMYMRFVKLRILTSRGVFAKELISSAMDPWRDAEIYQTFTDWVLGIYNVRLWHGWTDYRKDEMQIQGISKEDAFAFLHIFMKFGNNHLNYKAGAVAVEEKLGINNFGRHKRRSKMDIS